VKRVTGGSRINVNLIDWFTSFQVDIPYVDGFEAIGNQLGPSRGKSNFFLHPCAPSLTLSSSAVDIEKFCVSGPMVGTHHTALKALNALTFLRCAPKKSSENLVMVTQSHNIPIYVAILETRVTLKPPAPALLDHAL